MPGVAYDGVAIQSCYLDTSYGACNAWSKSLVYLAEDAVGIDSMLDCLGGFTYNGVYQYRVAPTGVLNLLLSLNLDYFLDLQASSISSGNSNLNRLTQRHIPHRLVGHSMASQSMGQTVKVAP